MLRTLDGKTFQKTFGINCLCKLLRQKIVLREVFLLCFFCKFHVLDIAKHNLREQENMDMYYILCSRLTKYFPCG